MRKPSEENAGNASDWVVDVSRDGDLRAGKRKERKSTATLSNGEGAFAEEEGLLKTHVAMTVDQYSSCDLDHSLNQRFQLSSNERSFSLVACRAKREPECTQTFVRMAKAWQSTGKRMAECAGRGNLNC